MKIIVDAGGQTCNRFWGYISSIYESLSTKEKIVILIPDVTIADFNNLREHPLISFPLYYKNIHKLRGKKYFRDIAIIKKIFLNEKIQKLCLLFFKKNIKFIKGQDTWSNIKDFTPKINEIREIFIPNDNIISKVDSILKKHRAKNELIIAVHIRWGDYKKWKNGQYYFTLDEYKNYMQKTYELFTDKKISFLICSNEKINLSQLLPLNCFSIANASATEDLYALMSADYILGTTSSFSAWASLIAQKPYYCITNKNDYKTLKLSDYSITKNWDFSTNGVQYDRT
ncbi:alpha-1,2-fucosyltransferase [uncultured Bacteroides sp.]|jgi:hypothetical protein|uniref:alpha-1,2-fucosyltransferase n=1 Tax=uncultured Bacteroides sp. TaxID=162156 RepID=UPI00280B7E64|nr:alpha-1,2-fucosyltransferase [uncultured Bacteroides sp.]